MNDSISLELSVADIETLLSALRSIALDAECGANEWANSLCFDWEIDAVTVVMRNKYNGEAMPISTYVHMLLEIGSSVL